MLPEIYKSESLKSNKIFHFDGPKYLHLLVGFGLGNVIWPETFTNQKFDIRYHEFGIYSRVSAITRLFFTKDTVESFTSSNTHSAVRRICRFNVLLKDFAQTDASPLHVKHKGDSL